jgi:hypothetical protein
MLFYYKNYSKKLYVRFKNKIYNLKLFIRNYTNFKYSLVFKHAIKIYNNPLNQRNLIRE